MNRPQAWKRSFYFCPICTALAYEKHLYYQITITAWNWVHRYQTGIFCLDLIVGEESGNRTFSSCYIFDLLVSYNPAHHFSSFICSRVPASPYEFVSLSSNCAQFWYFSTIILNSDSLYGKSTLTKPFFNLCFTSFLAVIASLEFSSVLINRTSCNIHTQKETQKVWRVKILAEKNYCLNTLSELQQKLELYSASPGHKNTTYPTR